MQAGISCCDPDIRTKRLVICHTHSQNESTRFRFHLSLHNCNKVAFIRRLGMEETTKKLAMVVVFLSVVVVTLFGLAPAI